MKPNRIIIFAIIVMTLLASCSADKNAEQIISKESRPAPDLSAGVLNEEVLWHLGRVSAPTLSPDGKTLLFGVKYFDASQNKGNLELYTLPVSGGTPTQISTSAADEAEPTWRPDGQKIGFLYATDNGMQLWECNPDGSDRTQISNVDGGINGFAYAPDMSKILYLKNVQIDPTIVERYPDLPEANAMIYDDLMYRHWDSWADGTYSHIFIADYPNFGNTIELLENQKFSAPVPPFGGMEQVVWSPDSKKIAYCSKKMSGKQFAESTNSDIYIYNVETREETNLTAANRGYDMEPVWSPDGGKIVWWSMETDGFESDKKRIMVHDFANGKTEDFSADFDQNSTNFVWNGNDELFFISSKHATFQLYKLTLNDRKIEQLTEGDHDYTSLLIAGNQLITTKMTHALPTEIFAVNTETKAETQLTFVNDDILSQITLAKSEKRWVKTTDGKEMLVWVVLPPNFDSTKRYPTLLFCEGGPQSEVSQFFSYRWNFQVMAAHGYIVVAPNRRGLPSFGKEWNDQISGDYGGQNMKDYLSAIDALAQEPYVDETRLGAVGASYGGFSVYWLAGHHEKRFKAFIAHCGMFNFESWYGTTEELFFANHDIEGAYWQTPTPKSYDFSPHRFVKNWDTPILVIHGGRDFRIPYTEGMQAFDAAQMQGIPSRFLYFPEESHFVLKPQNSLLWQREFFRFLDQYLK